MTPTRLSAAVTLLTIVSTAPALAQFGSDSMKNHAKGDTIVRETPHWHFDGKVSSVNPPGHQITIAADSIPLQYGGKTTLPYDVPPSIPMSRFHEGDRVNANLVVRDKRSFVEDLKFGPTPPVTAKKTTTRKAVVKKTTTKKTP